MRPLLLVPCAALLCCSPVPATLAGDGEHGSGAGEDGGTAPVTPNQPPATGELSEDGGNCGVQKFTLGRQSPDLLIVLDASGSMEDPLSGAGSRWSAVTSVLKQTVSSTQADIGWGLEIFPVKNDFTCAIGGEVKVPVGPQRSAEISKALDAHTPTGGTPTAGAIRTGLAHLLAAGGTNPKFMLLATDGLPTCAAIPTSCSCPSGQTPQTVGGVGQCCTNNNGASSCTSCPQVPTPETFRALREAAEKGVHTFVVGVGLAAEETANLDEMAIAGKEPRAGTPRFYAVSNQSELVSSINSISKGIISCTFALSAPPPRPEWVNILINGQKVPKDPAHVEGWDYGGGATSSLQFFGSYCKTLQDNAPGTTVTAVYGCGLN